MPALFVTGTGTEIGKTYVTAALLQALRARGHAVDAFKPVVSGFDPAFASDSDPGRLLAGLARPVTPETVAEMSPWRYAAPLSPPLAAKMEGRALVMDEVAQACRERIDRAGDTLLLIEGAGGIMSPVDEDHTNLDLIQRLGAPILLVSGSYLGTISHTLTAVEAARARCVAIAAIVVSESEGEPPDLAETVAAIARFTPGVTVVAAPRSAGPGWETSLTDQLGL